MTKIVSLSQFGKEGINKADLQVLIVPGLFLVGVVAVLLVGGSIVYVKIQEARDRIDALSLEKEALSSKLNILRQYNSDVYGSTSDDIARAFPSDNPVVGVISIIRRKAQSAGIALTSFSSRPTIQNDNESKLAKAEVTVVLNGNPADIVNMLKGISDIAPVVRVESVKSMKDSDTALEVTVSVYWATFPDKIPAVTAPVVDLTADEKEILTKLSALEKVEDVKIPPQLPSDRIDPFGI